MKGTDTQLDYDYSHQHYEAYANEREALRHDVQDISKRYDAAVLALAGGALVLSLTFVEKIAPHPASWTLAILGCAWLFLMMALLLELHALAMGQAATREQIDQLDEGFANFIASTPTEYIVVENGNEKPRGQAERLKRYIKILNNGSLVALTLGISLLCFFSFCNLPYSTQFEGRSMSRSYTKSGGSYFPPPNIIPPPPPRRPASNSPVPQTPDANPPQTPESSKPK